MKPYGKNDKEKKLKKNCDWCDCYWCVPVKKSTKKSERLKAKKQIKKDIKD